MGNEKKDKHTCVWCSKELVEVEHRFDGDDYCEKCFEQHIGCCENCGDNYYSEDGVYIHDLGSDWCDSCACDQSGYCDSCGNYYSEDVSFCSECDCCGGCCDCEETNRFFMRPIFKFFESATYKKNKSKRFVGVEIETETNRETNSDLRPTLEAFGLANKVEAKHDGSLNNGVEFITYPMNGDELYRNIRNLCKVLNRNGYRIETSCGLHIHFDARDLNEHDIERIYYVYHTFSDFLFEMVSPSRRTNNYCYKLPMHKKVGFPAFKGHKLGDWNDATNSIVCERYNFLNLTNYFNGRNNPRVTKKTIEIRNHNGTLDSKKIINWIRINEALINWALKTDIKKIMSLKNRLSGFFSILNDKGLEKYILKRRKKFNTKIPRKVIKNIKADFKEVETNVRKREGITLKSDLHILDISETELYKFYGSVNGQRASRKLFGAYISRERDARYRFKDFVRFIGGISLSAYHSISISDEIKRIDYIRHYGLLKGTYGDWKVRLIRGFDIKPSLLTEEEYNRLRKPIVKLFGDIVERLNRAELGEENAVIYALYDDMQNGKNKEKNKDV